MRYNNPLRFLVGAACAGRFVNAFARRAIFCVLALLAFATLSYAKPSQAPPVESVTPGFCWVVTTHAPAQAPACTNCPCGLDDCPCGCCDGKACTCRKKSAVTRKVRVNELSKPYARRWMAEGWTWNEEGGYWWKMPRTPRRPTTPRASQIRCQPPQTQFMPMQSFGGGGFSRGGGGCSS